MEAILITYDLIMKPESSYTRIIEKIKELIPEELRFNELRSTFIIFTEMDSTEVFKILRQTINSDDKLLVLKLDKYGEWNGISEKGVKFLESYFR